MRKEQEFFPHGKRESHGEDHKKAVGALKAIMALK
jgi:hypothetical protein